MFNYGKIILTDSNCIYCGAWCDATMRARIVMMRSLSSGKKF